MKTKYFLISLVIFGLILNCFSFGVNSNPTDDSTDKAKYRWELYHNDIRDDSLIVRETQLNKNEIKFDLIIPKSRKGSYNIRFVFKEKLRNYYHDVQNKTIFFEKNCFTDIIFYEFNYSDMGNIPFKDIFNSDSFTFSINYISNTVNDRVVIDPIFGFSGIPRFYATVDIDDKVFFDFEVNNEGRNGNVTRVSMPIGYKVSSGETLKFRYIVYSNNDTLGYDYGYPDEIIGWTEQKVVSPVGYGVQHMVGSYWLDICYDCCEPVCVFDKSKYWLCIEATHTANDIRNYIEVAVNLVGIFPPEDRSFLNDSVYDSCPCNNTNVSLDSYDKFGWSGFDYDINASCQQPNCCLPDDEEPAPPPIENETVTIIGVFPSNATISFYFCNDTFTINFTINCTNASMWINITFNFDNETVYVENNSGNRTVFVDIKENYSKDIFYDTNYTYWVNGTTKNNCTNGSYWIDTGTTIFCNDLTFNTGQFYLWVMLFVLTLFIALAEWRKTFVYFILAGVFALVLGVHFLTLTSFIDRLWGVSLILAGLYFIYNAIYYGMHPEKKS